ncbi:Eco57I restriction-modification methylase domain-containing protein [Fusobacterium ulcerans]|uniref:Eco57I restriction-modification methylase domain-containing protein n=1 Tax=Fusobacterium ulcerans TaxID=861 RepID=UPI00164DB0B9|nr:Eco57I restriction-modification methylase domain-containing protein [Fusobacterium ulcerans]
MKIIDYVINSTTEYTKHMSKELRKKSGQFFTSKETALFMASLFDLNKYKSEISILDPGAGSGILSAALIEHINKIKNINKIKLTCYENDNNILELLKNNLIWIAENSRIKVEWEIIPENYITNQRLEYNGINLDSLKYDGVIGNPPYMKIAKTSTEAEIMSDVCYGAPNMYFLFMTMGMFNLTDDGELVFIIPRSWTSGAYFRKFRQKILNEGILEHIHLFISRDKVFEKETILQETMIVKVRKTNKNPESIVITTTQNNGDFSNKTIFKTSYDNVVAGENKYVYLVTNKEEADILEKMNTWSDTLPSIGLKMKTGLTVDFRNRNMLRNCPEKESVPLFYSQHIKEGKVIFPIGKENEYILTNQSGLLQENTNYLFVKRFTAKEERRRLQCGIYLSKKYSKYKMISTQNKINFITGLKSLSECMVYGLYVLFNSTLYDSYYRILNGSTQVNSTEINSMPVPPVNTIEKMGKELMKIHDMSEDSCNKILGRFIYE